SPQVGTAMGQSTATEPSPAQRSSAIPGVGTARGVVTRQAVLVLGMHRSGTSAVARLANLLGTDLPKNILPIGIGNELGHFEPARAVSLNEEMLQSAGSSWSSLFDVHPTWFQSIKAKHYIEQVRILIDREFESSPFFVIKDPRISLLFPIWRAALELLD